MSFKSLFWKGDGGDSSSEPEIPGDSAGNPSTSPRPVQTAATLAALRTGPSATLYERTTGVSPHSVSVSQPVSGADRELIATIENALNQDSKEVGFREFIAQSNALERIIPDQRQCAAAALVAVAAAHSKLDSTQIARAIGERLRLLTDYESGYQSDSEKSQGAEIADKTSAVAELEGRVRDLDAEIARLNGEREQALNEVARLQEGLSGVAQKYEENLARFRGAVNALRVKFTQLLNFVAPSAPK